MVNAISGPAPNAAVTRIWTNAPVRPVRAVTSNARRAAMPEADRYEPSGGATTGASLVYGRDGRGGQGDRDGDAD